MKRNLLDITQKIGRKIYSVKIEPFDLNDPTYWIYEARGWKFIQTLREIEIPKGNDKLFVTINSQYISPKDYIVKEGNGSVFVKFKKSNFPYTLDETDYIEIKGDIEPYA